jgi:D-glycero-D-manno-heptose 1,7-bisphosphate phosphatase
MRGSAQAMTECKIIRRAVFLDRDGVINPYVYNSEFGTVDSPANPEEFTLLPGVGEAITQFNHLGLLVVVVSNQPGIAKGRFSNALLEAMTVKMENLAQARGGKIDGVYYCLHHPQASLVEYRMTCDCRKPAAGMLRRAAADWNVDLKKSYMVGDGIVDIIAGQAAETTTILISPRKGYVCDELSRQGAKPNYWAAGLLEAAQLIHDLEGGERPIASSPGGTTGIGGMR